MAHLIDKDALVAEIEKLIEDAFRNNKFYVTTDQLNLLKHRINTLEVKEVDLEHEVESYWKQCDMTWCRDAYSMTHIRSMLSDIAKHFFELGISVSNSTKVTTPDVDDVLKENGVNPDSKEAKIIKESYFMAIEKLAQKGEEV